MRFDLQAQPDDTFTLTFRSVERRPWTSSKWEGIVSLLGGLPYQTIYLDFPNLNGAALNSSSAFGWDDQKRRVTKEIAAPVRDNPAWRYRIYFDGRNENWNISSTFVPAESSPAAVNLEVAAGGIELQSIRGGRWDWGTGLVVTSRRFRDAIGLSQEAAPFFHG